MTHVEVYLYLCQSTTVHMGRYVPPLQSLSNTPETIFSDSLNPLCPFLSVTEWIVENKDLGSSWILSVLQEC